MTAPLKLPAEIEAAMRHWKNSCAIGSIIDDRSAYAFLVSAVLKYGDERYDRGNRDGMGLV